MKKWFWIGIWVLAVWVSSVVLWDVGGWGGSPDPVPFVVEEGETLAEISHRLQEAGLIRYPTIFRFYCRKYSPDIKFGPHVLSDAMSYRKLAKTLTEHTAEEGTMVTIPEGYEFRQIVDLLEDKGLIQRDVFCQLAEQYDFPYVFLENLPNRENRLEGYLFPATYEIPNSADELAILTMFLDAFDQFFLEEYRARAEELHMTWDEVIVLASIIQREAATEEEMPQVASVFYNRLQSEEYPYLQSCATVQYILQERKPVLSEADTKISSPYNTYLNAGLPLGPIASPGLAAIQAALYPAQTDYYFFVVGKDGEHVFSKTYEQHLDAGNGGTP